MDFDFGVIGGGGAGYAAARSAVGLGLRMAVIDGAEELGGLCILRGFMPSKTVIETTHVALMARHAGESGVRAGFDAAELRETAVSWDFAHRIIPEEIGEAF